MIRPILDVVYGICRGLPSDQLSSHQTEVCQLSVVSTEGGTNTSFVYAGDTNTPITLEERETGQHLISVSPCADPNTSSAKLDTTPMTFPLRQTDGKSYN